MANRVAIWPSGTRVVWRALTWGEYRKVRSLQGPPAEQALEVYKLCLVEGPAPDKVTAGIMTWIAKYELEQSIFTGEFTKISQALHKNREWVSNNYLSAAQALIVAAFRIPFAEMDSWDEDIFLKRLVQAEFIIGRPLDPVDPKAVKPQADKSKRPRKELTPLQIQALKRKQEYDRPHSKS